MPSEYQNNLYRVELFCIKCYPNKGVYPWWNDSYTFVDTVLVRFVDSDIPFWCWARDVPRSAEGKIMRGNLYQSLSGKGMFLYHETVEPVA